MHCKLGFKHAGCHRIPVVALGSSARSWGRQPAKAASSRMTRTSWANSSLHGAGSRAGALPFESFDLHEQQLLACAQHGIQHGKAGASRHPW